MSFGTIAPCDGIAEGHEGMRYILPSRDLIASSVECMVRAHRFDAMVLLGSCDKIVPGLLMAAARLDVPALFLNAGPMLPAIYRGKHWDGNIVTEAVGWKRRGEIGEAAFKAIEDLAEPCAGSCAMLGTANTMCCLAEAMGMALPGTATIPAVMARRLRAARPDGPGGDASLGAENHGPPADHPPLAGKRHGCAHGDGRLPPTAFCTFKPFTAKPGWAICPFPPLTRPAAPRRSWPPSTPPRPTTWRILTRPGASRR